MSKCNCKVIVVNGKELHEVANHKRSEFDSPKISVESVNNPLAGSEHKRIQLTAIPDAKGRLERFKEFLEASNSETE